MARLQLKLVLLIALVLVLVSGVTAFLLFKSQHRTRGYLDPRNISLRSEAGKYLEYTIDSDYEKASRLYHEAADNGDILAWMHWAYVQRQYLYDERFEFTSDLEDRIVQPVRRLADEGEPEAAFLMSMYYEHFDPDKHDKEIRTYLQRSSDGQFPKGMTDYGYELMRGYHGDKDLPAAKVILNKAAEHGSMGAMFQLGSLLSDAEFEGHDFKKSFEWYKHSAEVGYKRGFYAVGWCYDSGVGVKQDRAQALEWYRRGAEVHEAQCLYSLGNAYFMGDTVEKDLVKARQYFEESSAQGYPDAKEAIGYLDSLDK